MAGIKVFLLLLRKNFLVRKKHWIQSGILQVLFSIGLALLGQTLSWAFTMEPTYISEPSYYEIERKDDIVNNHFHGFDAIMKFTPRNNITAALINETRNCLQIQEENVSETSDEETMIAEFQQSAEKDYLPWYSVGIIFPVDFNDLSMKNFKYKVLLKESLMTELYDSVENGKWANYGMYYGKSIVPVQMCLDEAYIKMVQLNPRFDFNMSIQQMPYPPYTRSNSAGIFDILVASTVALAFLIILCVEISFPANEKFIGINILMSVNGVKNSLNLFNWLLSGVMYSTLYLLPIILIFKYFTPSSTILPFLHYGNGFIMWLILVLHICHLITFGYHISSYFWKPSHGMFAIFFVTVLLNGMAGYLDKPRDARYFLYFGIIFPDFLWNKIFNEIKTYEQQSEGIGWSNLFKSGMKEAPTEANIGVMMIFSIIGTLFHFFMTVYVYSVRPGKYGTPQGIFCCFQRRGNKKIDTEDEIDMETTKPVGNEFERVREDSHVAGIRIRGLEKNYTSGIFRKTEVHALRGVSVDFYKSEITALLGHNGAGKTTMMSIVSGMTDATDGIVFIDGKNIQHSPDVISNNIGLCPQENMVFPDLNVQQQLMFFGALKAKNKTKIELEHEVEVLLTKFNLTDKRTALPNELSGGQKRRLCLAMAVIGDGNVLILDEPTSGMDAESKREVWDIVLKMRDEKTIIISTHDMEEADILGDRIAIMHTGKLKSYGTSMFLKKLYGDGQLEVTLSIEPWCDLTKIFDEIGITTQVLNRDEGIVVLAMPGSEMLPELLDKIEISKKKLGITGISVSIITLEQIFIKVTQENNEKKELNNHFTSYEKVSGTDYYVQSFLAFFLKKIAFARKNPWSFWISLLLPCLAAVFTSLLFIALIQSNKPLELTLNVYPNSLALIDSDDADLGIMYKRTIENFHGSGTLIKPELSLTHELLNYANRDLRNYRVHMIVSGEFNSTGHTINANGFYSGSASRSVPITINCLSNALLKTLTNDQARSIEISAQSLPDPRGLEAVRQTIVIIIPILISFFLIPALAMYVKNPLQELVSGVKHLQNMTGASTLMYWLATFSFDFIKYIVSITLLLVSLIIVDASLATQLYHREEILITIGLLILFGMSIFPLVYLVSFFKKSTVVSYFFLVFIPIIVGVAELILAIVGSSKDIAGLKELHKIFIKILLTLFPQLSLTYGHYSLIYIVNDNARCRRMTDQLLTTLCSEPSYDNCCMMNCSNGICQKPFQYFVSEEYFPSLQTCMICLATSCVFYSLLIFIIEKRYISKLWLRLRSDNQQGNISSYTSPLDETVIKESNIVTEDISKRWINGSIENDDTENVFLVDKLKKTYGNFQAVKGISFRVKRGECFGLLGVNGAGKSTTFRMLTSTEVPQDGTVYLRNYNIATNRVKYLAEMGYCPQHNVIIDTLNAWDHLYLFARLRGIPNNQIHSTVKNWITKLNLTACASQPSGTYSGGNKRRLNIAMALIGNPSLVLMDEPTTGVDPAARRSLWNTLKSCQDAGQSIILTSHSMEECEVLCNRLAIMIKGQLVCVGATQELKQRFGAGYNIHVKLSPNRSHADVQDIKQHIESRLTCKLNDENTGFIAYHITDRKATWTIMYTMMNELKNEYSCIEDFAVFSSTLEQLFIQFARATDAINITHLSCIRN